MLRISLVYVHWHCFLFECAVILPVIVITIMTIQFFPLFVCVDGAPFPACTITHALGLFYSFVW